MANGNGALVGSGIVLSKGLASSYNFIPLTRWISTSQVKRAKAAIELRGDTGTVKVAPAYQTANDIDNPDAAAKLGTDADLGGDGIAFPTGYADISSSTDVKMFVRFGAMVAQDSDGGIHGGFVTIRVDVQGQ